MFRKKIGVFDITYNEVTTFKLHGADESMYHIQITRAGNPTMILLFRYSDKNSATLFYEGIQYIDDVKDIIFSELEFF